MHSGQNATEIPMIEADNLCLSAGGRRLCEALSLSLSRGEHLVLLGPNGCGKTTLLLTLAGLRPPEAGRIMMHGKDLRTWSLRELACFRGVLQQEQNNFFSATVLESVLMGRHPHLARWAWESDSDRQQALAALAQVGLEHMAARDVMTLSGGERQRMAIAALLAQCPAIFFLDEMTNHLDLHYQIEILQLFNSQADAGCAMVTVLHDINLAVRFADKVLLFDGKGHTVHGTTHDVMRPDLLSDAFSLRLRQFVLDGKTVFMPE